MKNGAGKSGWRIVLVAIGLIVLIGVLVMMNRASDSASHKAGVTDLFHSDD